MNNAGRNRVFDKKKWSGYEVNDKFCNLSRIVIDPRFRGAGIAGDFLRATCLQSPTRYVEMVTAMGQVNRFWEKAGFVDYGSTSKRELIAGQGLIYGKEGRHPGVAGTKVRAQSMTSNMHYYLCDTDSLRADYADKH